ncbi:MAG: histone acetyltransferase, partial [Desulfobacteraceae bacterium]|nr:histone acetyltransferase [Desulfobacteraceae bacterium]
DFARIYPLMVLKGSLLEQWYAQGKYHPISLEKSIQLVKEMVKIFEAANVDVIRMGLQSSDLMEDQSLVIAGPWHPAFGHLVYSEIMYDTACDQIDKCKGWESKKLFVKVHPKSESRLRGNKNGNLKKLYQRYPGLDLTIQLDERVPINQINIGLINN